MYFPPEFIQFCVFAGVAAMLIGLLSSRSRISRNELLGCWEPVQESSSGVLNEIKGNRAAKLCLYANGQMLMETVHIDQSDGEKVQEQSFEGTWNYQSPYVLCRNMPGAEEHGIQLRLKVHQFDRGELILSSGKAKQRWARCEEYNEQIVARADDLIQ